MSKPQNWEKLWNYKGTALVKSIDNLLFQTHLRVIRGIGGAEGGTVWKFHNFSINQILREIYFGDSRSAKSAILTQLEALKFDFNEFLHFLKAELHQINQIQRA